MGEPRYVNAYSPDDGEAILVDRAGGYAGPPRLERVHVRHACFVDRASLPRDAFRALKTARSVKAVETAGRYYRVSWSDRVACRAGCQWLEDNGVPTYEGNVDPLVRLMVERDIKPARPRTLFLDIEADPRPGLRNRTQMRPLVIGLVERLPDGTRRRKALVLEEDTDDGERRLLESLVPWLDRFDQIVSWYGDKFDEPVLKARFKKHAIPYDLRRLVWLDHLVCYKKQNAMSAEGGDEKASFALDAVCKAHDIPGKKSVDASLAYDYWAAGGEKRAELVDYCLNDADRMPAIEEKTGYLELFWTLCEATGVFPCSRNVGPSHQLESFLLRLAMERGHRFPSKFPPEKDPGEEENDFAKAAIEEKQFRGAVVMKPKSSGIHRDVHVIDFARMYPSIIRSLNLSPETKIDRPETPDYTAGMPSYLAFSDAWNAALERTKREAEARRLEKPPEGIAESSVGIWFRQEPIGLLALAVERLIELRKFWGNEKKKHPPHTPPWETANRRDAAYKIAANSFYGVVGQAVSMFFDVDVAESTTQTGAYLIRKVIELCESELWNMSALYGDTDSAFILRSTIEQMKAFVEVCNERLFPAELKTMGVKKNYIAIEYEKAFKRLVFSWNEKEKRPSAKKYAGKLLFFKGKMATDESKPEVKGLAMNRGDSIRLARQMQAEVVDLLISKEEDDPFAFDALVERWKKKIAEEPLPEEDLVVSQEMTQGLKEYAERPKKEPIHLGRCRVLKNDDKGLTVESSFLGFLGVKKTKLFVRYKDVHEKCTLAKFVSDERHKEIGGEEEHELLVNEFAAGSPHVRAAKMLEAHGTPVRAGDRVQYVIVDGSVSPKEIVPYDLWSRLPPEERLFDRVDLWLQVWTPSKHLLWGAFPDVDWHRFDVSYPRKVRAPSGKKPAGRRKVSAGQGSLFGGGQ